jgi:hypothetical protein
VALDSTTPVKTMVSSDLGGAVGTGDWFPMARKKSFFAGEVYSTQRFTSRNSQGCLPGGKGQPLKGKICLT